jgi:hypothetical protein
MKTISFLIALVTLVMPAAAGAVTAEEMAAFERLYIPALALTNQPQAPAARVAGALERLAAAWPAFRRSFAADPAFGAAIPRTDQALAEAGRLLAESRRAAAHDALEDIRPAFMAARRQANIELYVDRLSEFHDVMEDVVKHIEAGRDDAARSALEKASGLWSRAERPAFDAALFGFDEKKHALLRERLAGERAVIESLERALASGDRAALPELARRLKGNFGQIYVMFGDMGG